MSMEFEMLRSFINELLHYITNTILNTIIKNWLEISKTEIKYIFNTVCLQF